MLNNVLGVLGTPTPPVTNSYESIQTFTVGSGGAASITFGSGGTIPQTYKHLQIRGIMQSVSTGPIYMKMTANSDTAANYSFHQLSGSGANPVIASSGAPSSFMVAADGIYSTPGFSGAVIDLLDYTDTNKFKTMRSLSGQDNNGSGYVFFCSSGWRSTSAITSLTLSLSAGNFAQYSSFALYGIKG